MKESILKIKYLLPILLAFLIFQSGVSYGWYWEDAARTTAVFSLGEIYKHFNEDYALALQWVRKRFGEDKRLKVIDKFGMIYDSSLTRPEEFSDTDGRAGPAYVLSDNRRRVEYRRDAYRFSGYVRGYSGYKETSMRIFNPAPNVNAVVFTTDKLPLKRGPVISESVLQGWRDEYDGYLISKNTILRDLLGVKEPSSAGKKLLDKFFSGDQELALHYARGYFAGFKARSDGLDINNCSALRGPNLKQLKQMGYLPVVVEHPSPPEEGVFHFYVDDTHSGGSRAPAVESQFAPPITATKPEVKLPYSNETGHTARPSKIGTYYSPYFYAPHENASPDTDSSPTSFGDVQKTYHDTPLEYSTAETKPCQLGNVVSGAKGEIGETGKQADDATFDVFGTWEPWE